MMCCFLELFINHNPPSIYMYMCIQMLSNIKLLLLNTLLFGLCWTLIRPLKHIGTT